MTEFFVNVFLPVSLILMMLGLGSSLEIKDFKAILTNKLAVSIGLFGQLILLPLIAFSVAKIFALPPHLAIGLMIIAAAPGGVVSNIISFAVGGNTALSVLLTVISSTICVVTVPIIVSIALSAFAGAAEQISFPVLDAMARLFAITIAPVSVGFAIRRWRPSLGERIHAFADRAAAPFLLFLLAVIIYGSYHELRDSLGDIALALMAFIASMGALGYALSAVFGLDRRDAKTIMIEVSLQNTTLALMVAVILLENEAYAIVPGSYGLLAFFVVGAMLLFFRKSKTASARGA